MEEGPESGEKMSLKEKLIDVGASAGLILVLTGFTLGLIEQGKYERVRREVQLAIDSDKNKVITQEEWKLVYEFLGVKPKDYTDIMDIGHINHLGGKDFNGYGLDLTKEQLEEYLTYKKCRNISK